MFIAVLIFLTIFFPTGLMANQEIDASLLYLPSSSLKDQPGKITIIDSQFEYSHEFKAFDKLPVELSLDTAYINLNEKDQIPVSLPAKLTSVGFGAQATLPFFNFNKTYFRLKLKPTFNSDDWDVESSTLSMQSQVYLIYKPNEVWTFIGGLASRPGYEKSLWPIAGVIYKPNDRLAFNIIPDRPNITYTFNDRLSGFLEGDLSYSEFQVNKDGYKSAVLRYRETHAGGGLKLKVNPYLNAYLSAGRIFNRYLKYRDSLGKVDIKNDFYTQVRLEIKI